MHDKNLSTADVARRANSQLSPATIAKIASGEISSSSAKTIALIAEGLDVDKVDLLRLASGEDMGRPYRFSIYEKEFDGEGLSDSEWQLLETYFRQTVVHWRQFQRERVEAIVALAENATNAAEKLPEDTE
ncbi:MAG: helix-turn-helix transcriptional regulator [Acidobacteria bacterium]|nr:helix-turn-helix transcriptional regulator [Acidobacteriota bacterium]